MNSLNSQTPKDPEVNEFIILEKDPDFAQGKIYE